MSLDTDALLALAWAVVAEGCLLSARGSRPSHAATALPDLKFRKDQMIPPQYRAELLRQNRRTRPPEPKAAVVLLHTLLSRLGIYR